MPPTACPALAEFHAMVADHPPEDADPSEVVVGIETDRGRHERGVEVAPKSMSEMTTKAITPDAAVVSLAKNLNLFRVRHAGTPAGLNGAVRVPRDAILSRDTVLVRSLAPRSRCPDHVQRYHRNPGCTAARQAGRPSH
jgi:hypothetical protein